MEKIIILGSTGSIGTQALEIIRENKDIEVAGLACGSSYSLLMEQIEEFNPKYIYTKELNTEIKNKYPNIVYYYGTNGLKELVINEDYDTLLNSLVGSAGLEPTLLGIMNHKKILLANKETLVIGGKLVKEYLKKYNGTLYPIDSEHSSLWELLDEYKNPKKLFITASGGPFRDYTYDMLKSVKKEDALNHPNWKMGNKITIDSATLMNKGFELVEAYYLFDYPMDKIDAVINRESIVHAFIELDNGERVYASSAPSMKNPIMRALYYPTIRYENKEYPKDMYKFYPINFDLFKSIDYCKDALKDGYCNLAVLNAANEMTVRLFLNDKISFLDIFRINKEVYDLFKNEDDVTLENILKYDRTVKEYVLLNYGR